MGTHTDEYISIGHARVEYFSSSLFWETFLAYNTYMWRRHHTQMNIEKVKKRERVGSSFWWDGLLGTLSDVFLPSHKYCIQWRKMDWEHWRIRQTALVCCSHLNRDAEICEVTLAKEVWYDRCSSSDWSFLSDIIKSMLFNFHSTTSAHVSLLALIAFVFVCSFPSCTPSRVYSLDSPVADIFDDIDDIHTKYEITGETPSDDHSFSSMSIFWFFFLALELSEPAASSGNRFANLLLRSAVVQMVDRRYQPHRFHPHNRRHVPQTFQAMRG